MEIICYGTRGSYPIGGKKYLKYGGQTTCLLLKDDDLSLMVDCGSGIINALDDLKSINELHVLITHFHYDHVCGLLTLLNSFKDKPLHFYGQNLLENFNKLIAPPFYPIDISFYKNVKLHEVDRDFYIKDADVDFFKDNHPGGNLVYKVKYKNKCVVFGFDFNHNEGYKDKLIEFARNCDALFYDGYFADDEYDDYENYGHSTAGIGMAIGCYANAKKIYIIHHGIKTDRELEASEIENNKICKDVYFAKDNMRIKL